MAIARGSIVAVAVAVAVLFAGAAASPAQAARAGSPPCVVRAELVGIVNAASADHLEDAIATAEEQCAAALVVIDTPGGDLASTRRIARLFLGADVPVIAYVGPGARAGSAGMFVVLAAHVAAMAPGSNIGAAHPVIAGGRDPEDAGGEHLGEKVENDAAAFARAIAERHGRDAAWAEAAVRESRSATASEARELGVIDVVVGDERALLEAIDGRRVIAGDTSVTLITRGAEILEVDMTVSQRVRDTLGNPTLAYVLLLLGILGLVMEAYSPGMIVPGVLGAVALLVAAIALNAMPVSIGAVALIAVAAAFLIAEIYVTSFGLLALAGLGALILGASLLVDRSDPGFFADPSVRVSWGVVVPLAMLVTGAAGALAWMAARTQGRTSPTGAEGLVGERGRAITSLEPDGRVSVAGERWSAIATEHIESGAPVEVVGVEGLRLTVEPAGDEPGETS